jgi:hypothetical protein
MSQAATLMTGPPALTMTFFFNRPEESMLFNSSREFSYPQFSLSAISLSFYQDFAVREFTPPDTQGHRPYKTPNPDSSRSSATCPLSDQRLRSFREIVVRDFKGIEPLPPGTPNAELRSTGILRHVSLLKSMDPVKSGNRDSRFQ